MKNKEEAINNLKQYIEEDLIYKENKPQSDFDEFCINHCKDIETVLNYVKELEENKLYRLTIGEPPVYESEIILKDTLRKINANTDTYRDFTEEVIKLL